MWRGSRARALVRSVVFLVTADSFASANSHTHYSSYVHIGRRIAHAAASRTQQLTRTLHARENAPAVTLAYVVCRRFSSRSARLPLGLFALGITNARGSTARSGCCATSWTLIVLADETLSAETARDCGTERFSFETIHRTLLSSREFLISSMSRQPDGNFGHF